MESQLKKQEKKEVLSTEIVLLCRCSYHYWRFWVSDILRDTTAKFKRDEKGWDGNILVSKNELEKANNQLNSYKLNNPEIKDLWW